MSLPGLTIDAVVLILTSVISGTIGFMLQIFLPENIRSKLIYRVKRFQRNRRNKTVKTNLTARYDFEEEIPLSDASDDVRKGLAEIVDENSRIQEKSSNEIGDVHHLEIETSKADLDLEITIHAPPGGFFNANSDMDAERKATSITIAAEVSNRYRDLRWALELCADYVDRFQSVTDFDLDKSETYSVTCHLDSPTVIEDFLAKLSADVVEVENDSLEMQFEKNRVTVRNLALGDRPDVYDKLQELVIYYG